MPAIQDKEALQDVLVERVRAFLRDIGADPREFREALEALDAGGLRRFGSAWYYINLLSVFGRSRSARAIDALAASCQRMKLWGGWENCRMLLELNSSGGLSNGDPRIPVLDGWDQRGLRALLSGGKGLVVCTSHFGASRYVALDLAGMGFDVSLALDGESFRQVNGALAFGDEERQRHPRVWTRVGRGRVRPLDVEGQKLASLSLAGALRRGEIVVFFFDGNLGLDGAWGGGNRRETAFLGRQVAVKVGFAHLAAAVGAPVLSAIAVRDLDRFGHVECQGPMLPPRDSSEAGCETFAGQVVSALYGQLERLVLEQPAQWESACLLHRWRRPAADGPAGEVPKETLEAALARGRNLRLDLRRAALVETPSGPVVVDAERLRIIPIAAPALSAIEALFTTAGVDAAWLDGQRPEERTALLGALNLLWNRGLLECHADAPAADVCPEPEMVLPVGGVPWHLPWEPRRTVARWAVPQYKLGERVAGLGGHTEATIVTAQEGSEIMANEMIPRTGES
jgi:lauroyl/myristoyl acyltransferase